MIFKLNFEDRTEYAQAEDMFHLCQSYDLEFLDFQEIESVEEVSDKQAKTIMIKNNEYVEGEDPIEEKEFSLYDTVVGEDFCIVASSG